jgi:hypothetical protein
MRKIMILGDSGIGLSYAIAAYLVRNPGMQVVVARSTTEELKNQMRADHLANNPPIIAEMTTHFSDSFDYLNQKRGKGKGKGQSKFGTIDITRSRRK